LISEHYIDYYLRLDTCTQYELRILLNMLYYADYGIQIESNRYSF